MISAVTGEGMAHQPLTALPPAAKRAWKSVIGMAVLSRLQQPVLQMGEGGGGVFQCGQMSGARDDRKPRLRHQGVHLLVAVQRAKSVALSHQHQCRTAKGGQRCGLGGAVAQGARLAGAYESGY